MDQPSVLKSLAIGVAAGLFAAGVMEAAQAVLPKPEGQTRGTGKLITARAADRMTLKLRGHEAHGAERKQAERAVHYATGIGLGAIYALGAWAAGPPTRASLQDRAASALNHLLFGAVLSGAYRLASRAV